jgi:hypothetical protein
MGKGAEPLFVGGERKVLAAGNYWSCFLGRQLTRLLV